MRIISGTEKGRRLKEPDNYDIRPTTDKVKESMFNIIQFELENARVLDMFAGTGQLGLEALSRGAKETVFADISPQALKIVAENIKTCGFAEKAHVIRGDILKAIQGLGKFDIIFVDPPYDSDLAEKSLKEIIEFDILKENGIILCETRAEYSVPQAFEPYFIRKEYKYGKIKLAVYSKE